MDINFDRMVAEIGSTDPVVATNACGVVATLALASQCARTAVSTSQDIVANIEKALGSKEGNLAHNAALLVSMLSTVASFRLGFVKSKGLKHLVDLLNESECAGQQCNVLHALVTLAGAGRDCHSELYDSLVTSGVFWKARQLMCSGDSNVEANARALAQKLRPMPSALSLERMGSSDAVHALALLSCDNRASGEQITPPRFSKPLKHWSQNNSKKRKVEVVEMVMDVTPPRTHWGPSDRAQRSAKRQWQQDPSSSSSDIVNGVGLSMLASVIQAVV